MSPRTHRHNASGASGDEAGMALLSTLMVLVLLSSLLVGFTAMVASETRLGGLDAKSAHSMPRTPVSRN